MYIFLDLGHGKTARFLYEEHPKFDKEWNFCEFNPHAAALRDWQSSEKTLKDWINEVFKKSQEYFDKHEKQDPNEPMYIIRYEGELKEMSILSTSYEKEAITLDKYQMKQIAKQMGKRVWLECELSEYEF